MLTLTAQPRTKKDKLEALRKGGKIPAVFYGKKEKATSVSIPMVDFLKVWKKAGETSVIELKTADGSHDALIQEVSLDPVKNTPRHADFYIIEKGMKLKIKVPIEFIGVSPAVKDLGGILVKVAHALEIEAEAKDLPHTISVDISALKTLDGAIHAKDITLPNGVILKVNPEEVVASITIPKEEVEEVAPVDISKIEISEKKGKKEEEAVPGEEGAKPADKKEAAKK